MQRLFSTFPGGSPGVGLFLLRLAGALSVIARGSQYLMSDRQSPDIWILGLLWIAIGVAFVIGFLTPIVAALAALGSLGILFSWLPQAEMVRLYVSDVDMVLLTAAIALLGPGSLSLDAQFFGRREIIIPDNRLPPQD